MSKAAQLHLRDTPSKRVALQSGQPLTIGSASNNRLALVSQQGVSAHHAVVRFTASNGWVVCDWQSSDGTYLEGERIRRCRPLSDGDEIQLGRQGPMLVFSLTAAQQAPAPTPAPAAPGKPRHRNHRHRHRRSPSRPAASTSTTPPCPSARSA
jgi:predicted component of type VI protein secretion system